MEYLIKEAFLHVEDYSPHVDKGMYDLIGPHGEIVMKSVWAEVVEPGWSISMHMWPLPPPPEPADERRDDLAFDGARLNLKFELDNLKRSSSVSDDGQRESIRPSIHEAMRYADPNLGLVEKRPRRLYLHCPFYFLACKEEFPIWWEQEWVEHSLTHFQKKGRRHAGSVRTIEPPKSCCCNFCDMEFKRLTGAACWKDYMNHIATHCQLGHNSQIARLDFGLVEYLWEQGIITRENYRGLRLESETQLPDVSALGDEEQVIEIEERRNRKIQRASIETSTKREQWRRRICRRIVVFMLWKREQQICIPNELWSSPASFEFINVLEVSTFDKVKGLFETYSGREWNWWPFSAPVKPLESGRVRVRWQCVRELSSCITMC